jgi:hypothetical protein
MLVRLVLAAVAGAIAWLICVFIGGLLALTGIPIAAYIGEFMVRWAIVISILVAIWYFFAGGGLALPTMKR